MHLFPFSFRKYLDYRNAKMSMPISRSKIAVVKKLLREYMDEGGFPERYRFGRESPVRIYRDIMEKDIMRRIGVRKRSALKKSSPVIFFPYCKRIHIQENCEYT